MLPSDSQSGATSPLTNVPGTDPGAFAGVDLAVGTVLKDRYKIVRELSRGGFGKVFMAQDVALHDRLVVVKIQLDHSITDPWFERKFAEELRALTLIDHPGVVGALDSGRTADGKPFLVMQYVEGVNLRSVLTAEGLPLDRVADMVRQIGQALQAAHDKQIWHRDLKPENIMLQVLPGGEEHVKLIDFGIATIANLAKKDTRTRVAGSLHYMAPEQVSGQPTAATDVYAFGVISYEMITGRKPFTPDDATQLANMQRTGVRLKPAMLRPEISSSVERLILQSLNYNPADRPQSARAFGEELSRALAAAETTRMTFQPMKPKRTKLWIGLGAAALLLVAGGAWWSMGRSAIPEPAKQAAAPAPPPSPKTGDDESVELAYWNSVSSSGDPRMYREYLAKYPQGRFADLAKLKLEPLAAKPAAKPEASAAKTPAPAATRRAISLDEYAGPLRGQLRWLGSLPAGARLTIQGGQTAAGSYTGDLPRVPVSIQMLTAGVTIAEPPAADNQWDRIVLKNDAGKPVEAIELRWRVAK